ncbi:hypothetical protein AB1N83_005465 [Pleurotus pulmonarius]
MSTDRHEQTTASSDETVSSMAGTRVRSYENNLTPPAGTSFFEKQNLTVFDQEDLTSPSAFGGSIIMQTLTWRTDVYKRGDLYHQISNGVEFSVHLEEDVFGEWPVIAFSVFKCLDPSAFPVTFTFEATAGQRRNNVYTPQGTKLSKDIAIDFAFKP